MNELTDVSDIKEALHVLSTLRQVYLELVHDAYAEVASMPFQTASAPVTLF